MALPISRVGSLAFVRHASSALPRIAQPELWRSIIPRFLRPSSETKPPSSFRLFLRNPITHVAGLAVLCGSQAIQVIYMKNDIADTRRAAVSKLTLLNNVIERIKAGETVDLRKELGTGDPEAEKDWQELIEGIGDDATWLRTREQKKVVKEAQKQTKSLESLSLLKTAASSLGNPAKMETGEKHEEKKPFFY